MTQRPLNYAKRIAIRRAGYPRKMKDQIEVDGLDALLVAARRLREIDPDRFRVVLNLCRTYVAAFDRPEESDEIFASRIAELRVGRPKIQA